MSDSPLDSAARAPHSALCAKLSDFGLAKRTDRNEGLTVGPGALGTPGYMAPEQAAGDSVTPHADVYGLGATLYHALTGRAPFEGDPREAVKLVQESDPPRVRLLRPEVPVELEAIIHKCLERNPARRYSSAAELADDLDRFVAGEPVVAKPLTPVRRAVRAVTRRRRQLTRLAVAALALVGAVVLGAAVRAPSQSLEEKALRKMQDDLKVGKEVTLVGATGEPLWHRWVQGPSGFAPAGGRDQACAFQSFGSSMLDLCPDPMTDSYRFRAELCQLDVNGRDVNGQLPTGGEYEVGIYFGRKALTGNNGWRAESCMNIWFSEVPRDTGIGHARLTRLVIVESPRQLPTVSTATT